jgi:NAD(P)-dependent dehydrogenase (short-subunit alcohol dehydrogenase family)
MATVQMHERVCLISGATNGIGKATALALARLGATVIIVGRNTAKTESTVAEIKELSGQHSISGIVGDLSSMAEVRRVAAEFKQRYDRLHVLVNNAGGMFATRQETVDGYEMTFALNHLAYFLLTNLLLDVLKRSAPARVVNVASVAHRRARLDLDDLQSRKGYGGPAGFNAYAQSKLANVLFTYELARRLQGTQVTANVLHPGVVATGITRVDGGVVGLLMRIQDHFAITPEQGAQTVVYLASSPDVEGVTGQYFEKCKAVPSSPASHNETTARQLWQISEQLTGIASA